MSGLFIFSLKNLFKINTCWIFTNAKRPNILNINISVQQIELHNMGFKPNRSKLHWTVISGTTAAGRAVIRGRTQASRAAHRIYTSMVTWLHKSNSQQGKGKPFCVQSLETQSRKHLTPPLCRAHLDLLLPTTCRCTIHTGGGRGFSSEKTILAICYFFKDPQSYYHLSLKSLKQINNGGGRVFWKISSYNSMIKICSS